MRSLPPSPRKVNGHVYVTAPVDLFLSPTYAAAVEAARKQFPKLRVFDAAREFPSIDEWMSGGRDAIDSADALIVVPRPDGSIDASCAVEVLAFRCSHPNAERSTFVFEDGSLRLVKQYLLDRNGTPTHMAIVGSARVFASAEAVQQ